MNNYYIDASVYAYNFPENIQNEENTKKNDDYFERIRILHDLVCNKKPCNLKYFLSRHDFNFLEEKKFIDRNLKAGLMIAETLLEEINRKVIDFDDWFKIFPSIQYDSGPFLSNDISPYIKNEELKNNTKKNIALIAALNKYVYKNSKTYKIILNNDVNLNYIQITADFRVFIAQYKDDNNLVIRKIKGFPKNEILQINSQKVEITKLNVLAENKFICPWKLDHDVFLNTMKVKLSHIKFNPQCSVSLEQYKNKIDVKQQEIMDKYYGKVKKRILYKGEETDEEKQLDKIDRWKDQFYDVLSVNLETLNNYLDINNKMEKLFLEDETYGDCKRDCDKLENCGAHIRYFGADCVDETLNQKKNPDVEKDRKINNDIFWLHLRPNIIYVMPNEKYLKSCESPLWFLALRIHFRWISYQEIEVGFIGRHRFLPCKRRNSITKKVMNCNRPDCPVSQNSPLHERKLEEYDNFLKEWPK
jgi:hypothetical protein